MTSVTTAGAAPRIRQPMLGLTGPIASGKSTVGGMLEDLGAKHVDADCVYHELVVSGAPLWSAVVDRFGVDVVQPDGSLDREKLGSIVFNDREALADLERITHPAIAREIGSIAETSDAPVVVEAIKLAQAGMVDDLDQLWLVAAAPDVRVERLMKRGGLQREQALARIEASSDPLSAGVEPVVIIENSGDLETTRRQVTAAWNRLLDHVAEVDSRRQHHSREDQ